MKLTNIAKAYATTMHNGQKRKSSDIAYITHPKRVVEHLEKYGYDDEKTLAIAWLHDVVEDTEATINDIAMFFGYEIAAGVKYLTINNEHGQEYEKYKSKLEYAPENIQMIKLCDTLDNVKTLHQLTPKGIERKVHDCMTTYIPMAQELCPEIASELTSHIEPYNRICVNY